MQKSTSMLIVGVLIGLVSASGLFAVIGASGSGREATGRTLRLAHSLSPDHPVHAGMVHMAERVEEISAGRLRLTIYPSSQLGSETESLEQLQAGTLAMTKTSAAAMGNFISRMQAFSLPYIFRDGEHYWRVLDGEIGQELLRNLTTRDDGARSGLRGLCFFDAGSRNFYVIDRAIETPADLRGLKIRVMNDPVAIDMVDSMGGSAAAIPWSELYSALQQGVVDGAENNPPSFVSNKHYEVCRYFSFDQHTRIPDVLVVSDAIWQQLDEQERQWLSRAAQEASLYQRELWRERTEESVRVMEEAGVTITRPDLAPFREAAAPVLEHYADTPAGKLARRIQEAE